MTSEEDLFFAALELPDADRAAFLDRACAGAPALRARLDQLLAAHATADAESFLANITFQPGLILAPSAEDPGTVIAGRYTIVRKLGEGGCGAVYLAEQTTPIRRQVALKIIKLGMDTREVIARFEAEHHALALMDHADIAHVLDAGATATGRPFFVMEFVDGIPLTKFCAQQALDLPARLALFIRICHALQHAHQKGIIHRDLKPSNILVSFRDGVPAPRIIDFGIAKATSGRLGDQTLVTIADHFLGTPAYMSPEQAGAGSTDIDTRSDIYSLGTLLYELLAGRPIYDPKSLAQAGHAEIRRLIREVNPPRPSTHAPELKGDLDWIVMRCLEKDRARRYVTASALADDLQRYLEHEPITARPPSTLYRIRKFVARNRLATAALTAVSLAVLAGLATSTTLYFRAHRAELRALAERDHATAATAAATLARADAQRRQDQSEALINYMLDTFRDEVRKIGRLELLDTIGEKALAYFASLDPRDLNDITLTQQVKALTQIGSTRIEQARYRDADTAFTTAFSRAIALTTRHPENSDMLIERAQVEFWIGLTARYRGDFAKTQLWFDRYRASALAYATLTQRSDRAKTQLAYSQHSLALLALDLGHLAAARTALLDSQAVKRELLATEPASLKFRASLAATDHLLGLLAESEGRFADALAHYRTAATTLTEVRSQDPRVPIWHLLLVEYQTAAARMLALQADRAAATTLITDALDRFTHDPTQPSDNHLWQSRLLDFRLEQLSLLLACGDLPPILPLQADTLAQSQALVARAPSSHAFSHLLAEAWVLESRLRRAQHRSDAPTAVAQAIAINDAFIARGQPDIPSLWTLGQARLLAGRLALADAQSAAARQHWQHIVTTLTPHAADSDQWRLLDPLAQAHLLLGDPTAAAPYLARLRALGYHPIDPEAATLLKL